MAAAAGRRAHAVRASAITAAVAYALFPAAASAGAVAYSGYLIDNLCYQKCESAPSPTCAPDGTNVITHPEEHTVACMLIEPCVASGYYLAKNTQAGGAEAHYQAKFRLDAAGNAGALAVLRGTATTKGLKVTVHGQNDGAGVIVNATVAECAGSVCDGGDGVCDGDCTTADAETDISNAPLDASGDGNAGADGAGDAEGDGADGGGDADGDGDATAVIHVSAAQRGARAAVAASAAAAAAAWVVAVAA